MNKMETIFNEIKPVYLIYGEDNFLLRSCKEQFIKRFVTEDLRDFNFTYLEDGDNFAATLKNQANTLPFMADKRYIIARTSDYFTSKSSQDDLLLKLFENFPETTILTIIVEGKIDKRLKLVQRIGKMGKIIQLEPPKYKELDKWIVEQFNLRKKKVDSRTISFLEEMFGNELELLQQEIEKISVYAYKEEKIIFDKIQGIISRDKLLEENYIFKLTDSLMQKKKSQAISILNEMLKEGVQPLSILSTIVWQLRLFLSVKVLKDAGKDPANISQILNSHQYPVKKCYQLSNNFSEEEVELMLERLLQADLEIVTGRYSGDLALQLAIIKSY
jgi:DNA polymerase III subunit delta